ncbi:MAG: adenosylcobinamide-GDP ribazoletransferase [Trebonia sp.]
MRRPAWRIALSLFTVIPVGGDGELGPGDGARAIRWLPAVGLLLGLAGACLVLGVGAANGSGPGRALGAALAVALVAFLTGGLHLDGLADTADGLGSRRPAAQALEIMRRSDIGPMGVTTLVLVLLVQVTALAAIPHLALAAAALTLAEVTGRVAIVVATEAPAARPGGFGTLVAGQTTVLDRALSVGAFACAVAAAGLLAGGPGLAVRGLIAAAAGLAAGFLLQSIARRRLGGTTGDVFGAIEELSATAVLVAAALLT